MKNKNKKEIAAGTGPERTKNALSIKDLTKDHYQDYYYLDVCA